jgi:hypothetical protein
MRSTALRSSPLTLLVIAAMAAAGPISHAAGLAFDVNSNSGWEGGRSDAPFLYVNVPAGQDFTAEVTIGAQTSGFWSDAGIIARAKQGTPPGTDANNADENFTFFGSFRTDAALTAAGNTLHKRIEAGAQVQDANIAINAGDEPLPIRLRLAKVGSNFEGWVSPDNGTTWQLQSTATPTAGNPLGDPAVPLEVGLAFSPFDGALNGVVRFENFTLNTTPAGTAVSDLFTTPFDYSTGAVTGIWSGSYNMANLGVGGTVIAVPEPTTLAIAVVGACCLATRRRRIRR